MVDVSLLGQVLSNEGLVSESQLAAGLEAHKRGEGRVGECLVALGHLSDSQLMWALAKQLDIPYIPRIDTLPESLDCLAIARIPGGLAHQLGAFPVFLDETGLTVVMEDPLNVLGVKVLERVAGVPVRPALTEHVELRRALDVVYKDVSGVSRATTSVTGWGIGPELRAELLSDESGRRLMDWILEWAMGRSASELCFYASDVGGVVRVRGGDAPAKATLHVSRAWYVQLLTWLKAMDPWRGLVRFLDGASGQSAVLRLEAALRPVVSMSEGAFESAKATQPGLLVLIHPDKKVRDEAAMVLAAGMVDAEVEILATPDAVAPEGASRLRRDGAIEDAQAMAQAIAFEPEMLIVSVSDGWAVAGALRKGRPRKWLILPCASRDLAGAVADLSHLGMSPGNLAASLAGIVVLAESAGESRGVTGWEALFSECDERLRRLIVQQDLSRLSEWRPSAVHMERSAQSA